MTPAATSFRLLAACLAVLLGVVLPSQGQGLERKWLEVRNTVTGGGLEQDYPKVALDPQANVLTAGATKSGRGADWILRKLAKDSGTPIWEKRFTPAGSTENNVTAITVDATGDLIVTGTAAGPQFSDYYTAKFSGADGNLLWERRQSGPGSFWDVATAVTTDSAGNVIVTGYSGTAFNSSDYLTLKYSAATGTLLWSQRYTFATGSGSNDLARTAQVDAAGNVLVAGVSNGCAHAIKYSGVNGTILWNNRHTVAAGKNSAAFDLALDAAGNAFVTGFVGPIPGQGGGYDDLLTLKFAAADGAILWEQHHDGPEGYDDGGLEIRVNADGDAIIAGYSQQTTNLSSHTLQLLKIAGDTGNPLWVTDTLNRMYTWDWQPDPRELSLDAAGNVLITGNNYNSSGHQLFVTGKYAGSDGTLIWDRSFTWQTSYLNYQVMHHGDDIVVDPDGNVLVTGVSTGSRDNTDHFTMKYAPDGMLLWQNRHDTIYHRTDVPGVVKVDKDGDVILAGATTNPNDHDEFHLWKNNGSTGALIWEVRRERSDAVSDDVPVALATDANGDVLLAGTGDYSFEDTIYLAKFAGTNGSLLWERRIVTPSGKYRRINDMVVDAAGNLFVTGWMGTGQTTSNDAYTAKYDGITGATLWEKTYDASDHLARGETGVALVADAAGGVAIAVETVDTYSASQTRVVRYAGDGSPSWQATPVAKDGRPSAITVDTQGNFSITGVAKSGTYHGILAAKFTPAGAPVWEKVITGPASWAEGNSLATDTAGNVIVTGYIQSSRPGADYDYQTFKFSGSTGNILWQKTYTGPFDDDVADGLVVDGSGNVIITGTSETSDQRFDLHTIKYSASGSLLGENRYTASIEEQKLPFRFRQRAIAIGGPGRVAVANRARPSGKDYDLALMVFGVPLPKLVVERYPAGTAITHGGTVDAGSGANNISVDFRIRNTGTGPLTFTTPTVTAGATGALAVTIPPSSLTLAAGGSTTFRVTLAKIQGGGSGSGTVQFTSNDATAAAFQFTVNYYTLSNNAALTVLGPDAGTLSPLFEPAVTDYDLQLPFDQSEVRLTPASAHPAATVKVNGATVAAGSASEALPVPAAGTEIVVTVTAEDGITTATYRLQANRLAQNLAEWRFLRFNSADNSGTAADTSDSDGDGVVNLLEYAFGLDPDAPDGAQVPGAVLADGYLTIRFTEPAGVSGITYGASSSEHPGGDWSPVPDEGVAPEHLFRVPVSGPCRFLRLEANPAAP